MNAPCGHKQAVCVIGNFWTCSICDKPAIADAAGRPFNRAATGGWRPTPLHSTWSPSPPLARSLPRAAGEWSPTPLHTTWSPGLGGVGALSKVLKTVIADNPLQRRFPPHVQFVADSGYEPERKKAYTLMYIETGLVSPWEFVAVQHEVDKAVDRHNDYVASEIYLLAEQFRGGPWHVRCLGQPVHTIEDDGHIAVLTGPEPDAPFEIRLRSFYRVCKGEAK